MSMLQDALYQITERFPENYAFDDLKQKITFSRFVKDIESLAGALQSIGVKKGDRLAILSHNCPDYIAYHYAAAKIGAILHVLNTRHVVNEMDWALKNAESSVLIIDAFHEEFLPQLRLNNQFIHFSIGLDGVKDCDYQTADLKNSSGTQKKVQLAETDPVLLIYTSGTTGQPKGALQTHRGSVMANRLTAEWLDLSEHDVYLALMPYFHQAGLIRTRATMNRGGINLTPGKLDEDSIVDLIDKKQVSVTMIPSLTYFNLILKKREQGVKFPNFRFIISGGGLGAKTMEMMKMFCDLLGCNYLGVYGQTEATGPITLIRNPECYEHPDSCGKALEGIDLQIWDDNHNELPAGQVGEIVMRAPTTVYYWNNEEANKNLYTDKWLHTGDLGKLDEDGYLYFVDRKKELIKTGAENVYPKEVEQVLMEHPSISEVAIIGLPDPKWGEAVSAVVVLKPDESIDLDDLKNFCREKIAGYKIPKNLKFVDHIPRNATGKVMKRLLHDQSKS